MPNVFVGIDVSKEWFDVAVRPTGAAWRAAQDEAGITQLVKQLCNLHPRLVVLEATGGYETPLVVALGTADIPVAVVNPRQVRDFARSLGKLAKTDRLDAAAIAHFAEASGTVAQPLAAADARELEALVARRRQVIQMKVAEQQRRERRCPSFSCASTGSWPSSNKELYDLDQDLTNRLRHSPLWHQREDLLRSVPGVRPSPDLHPVGWPPRAGHVHPQTNRRLRWCRAPQPGQWQAARRADLLGRARARARCPLTCPPSWPCATVRSFVPSMNGSWPQASPRRSPSLPVCVSC